MAWFTAKSSSFWQTNLPYVLVRLFAVLGVLLTFESLITKHIYHRDSFTPEFPRIEASRYKHSFEDEHSPLNPNVVEEETRPGSVNGSTSGQGSKIVIASCLKGSENATDWIHEHLPDWDAAIYVVNDPHGNLTVAKNKGREASVYLSFIINHYYNLPDYMVFVHGKRYEWHSDDPMYDTLPTIANLSLSHLDEVGYASLRCTWEPGCPEFLWPDIKNEDSFYVITGLYAQTFKKFFPRIKVPRKVAAPCCAQFAVSRTQVLARPVTDYERYRDWLWSSPESSMKTGYVMEYMWHIIFGKPAAFCNTPAKKCFCEKFGHCDLKCPGPGRCLGRYIQKPYNKTLPKDWPNVGQGEYGLPVDGWWNDDV